MNTQATSLYQRVIDKTKTLAFQSQFVAQNIDKKKAAEVLAQSGGVSGEFCLIWGGYYSLLLQAPPPQGAQRWAPS